MKSRIMLTAFVLLMVMGAFTILTDDSSAETAIEPNSHVRISGDFTLTEDTTFEDGSEVTILGETVINLSTYTLDFGKESRVIIIGSLIVRSSNGSMIFGEKTSLLMIGVAIPGFDMDITYTFDGDLMFDKGLIRSGEAGVTYQPHGKDPALHISWENTRMDVCDPALSVGIVSEGFLDIGVELVVMFSTVDIHIESYEDDVLVSTEDTRVETNKDSDALDIVIMTMEDPVVQSVEIKKVETVTKYTETGIMTKSVFDEIGPTTITMDETKIQTVSTHVNSMISERYENDVLQNKEISKDINFTIDVDPTVLIALIKPTGGDQKLLTDIMRYMKLTVKSMDMLDYKKQEEKHLSDIAIEIDNRDTRTNMISLVMVDVMTQDTYTIKAEQTDFEYFDMSRSLVINTDMSIEYVAIIKNSVEKPFKVALENVSLKASNLDIKDLYKIYARTGTLDVQQVLDNCDRLELGFGYLGYDEGAEGIEDLTIHDGQGLLCVDSRDQNTGTFSFSNLRASLFRESDLLEMELQYTRLYVESEGSLTECLDAFTKGINFTTDSHSQLQLTNDGIDLKYIEKERTTQIITGKVSPSSTSLSVVVSIDHSTYQNTTFFKFNISSIGYNINFIFHNDYDDPSGTSDVSLSVTDMTGGVDFSFGDSISFKVDINTPWSLDFNYYDIAFQADGRDSVIGVNHSDLKIDGYDYKEQGFFEMFKSMSENNFTLDCRISYTEEHITVYKEERTLLYEEYDDVELDIRDLFVELVRQDHRNVSLDKIHLALKKSDGSSLDRTIRHLDVFKDLSDPVPSRSYFEDFATYLTVTLSIVCVAMVLIMLGLRIRRPDLFRFRE